MGKFRRRGAQRTVEQDVLGRVGGVVVATHDVRDRHIYVVDNNRQVVGRVTVGPQNDEILNRCVVNID